MKKIIIYTPYTPSHPGAAGVRVHYLANALSEKGHNPLILSPADGKGLSLALRIRHENPSLVIGTAPPLPPLWWIWLGSRLSIAPFVLDAKEDGRAMDILSRSSHSVKEFLFLSLRKWIYTHADALWFLTESDRQEARSQYGIDSSRLTLVTNGTDPRLVFDAVQRKKMRQEWKVSSQDYVILYAGSIGDEDLEGLLDSLPSISRREIWVFVLASDQSPANQVLKKKLQEKMRKKIPRSIIRENIPIGEMGPILSGGDIGIVPWRDSLPTSLPVKVFDYAGTGLPVVAKAPAGGELDCFLKAHPTWGKSVDSWDAFHQLLSSKKPSPSGRKLRAQAIHADWDRPSIMRKAVEWLDEKRLLL